MSCANAQVLRVGEDQPGRPLARAAPEGQGPSGGTSIATRKVSRTGPSMSDMTIQLNCPWCQEEVAFEVDETADELVCSACGIRTEFAPDPAATFSLLYDAA